MRANLWSQVRGDICATCDLSACTLRAVAESDASVGCPLGRFDAIGGAPTRVPRRVHAPVPSAARPPGRWPRPGAVLAATIEWATGRRAGTCGPCASRVRQMDEWGWRGCLRQRRLIAAWLLQEAERRGHRMAGRPVAWSLIRALARERRARKPPHRPQGRHQRHHA